jgi:hypothetical protein
MALNLVPVEIANKIGFYPISGIIKLFQNVSLQDIIRLNTKTTFIYDTKKYCWIMKYENLELTILPAYDSFPDKIIPVQLDNYIKQELHSISGEKTDLCLYTYGPMDLVRFIEMNKKNHYTFLPITIHAAESTNGLRHDMLLIFDNKTKLFYWFDGANRNDYLPFGYNIPLNAIDVLFVNLSDSIKSGYTYESTQSWQINGTFRSYTGLGKLDFMLSTSWCYTTLLLLDYFDSPTAYVSMIDSLSEADRFHLVYTNMMHMMDTYKYTASIPLNSQIDLTAETVRVPMPLTDIVYVEPVNMSVAQVVQHMMPNTTRSNTTPFEQPQDTGCNLF